MILSEKWIRDNFLTGQRIENVEELSLGGLHRDVKITSLGISLSGFVRLRALDLSRNAVESLEGLESLGNLEKLSLYHNKISQLEQILLLRPNTRLKDLDLRLNPVVNHPDYRAFTIHHIPSLQKLDGAVIRIHERKLAHEYFSTSVEEETPRLSASTTQKNSLSISPVRPITPPSSVGTGAELDELKETSPSKRNTQGSTHSLRNTALPERTKMPLRQDVDYSDYTSAPVDAEISKALLSILDVLDQHQDALKSSTWSDRRTNLRLKADLQGILIEMTTDRDVERKRFLEEITRLRDLRREGQLQMEEALATQSQLERAVESSRIDRESLKEQVRELSQKLLGAEQECAYLRHQFDSVNAQKEDGERFVMQAGGLIEMLKESHEALMRSNESLLQQVQDLKQSRDEERAQWQVTYQQLRKTFDSQSAGTIGAGSLHRREGNRIQNRDQDEFEDDFTYK